MSAKIKNLDMLEKEIYRLRRDAKNYKDKLEENLDYLQKNYGSLTMNSIFNHTSASKEKLKEKIFNSFWENEKINEGINKIVGHLTDKAAGGIENWIDKILQRKE